MEGGKEPSIGLSVPVEGRVVAILRGLPVPSRWRGRKGSRRSEPGTTLVFGSPRQAEWCPSRGMDDEKARTHFGSRRDCWCWHVLQPHTSESETNTTEVPDPTDWWAIGEECRQLSKGVSRSWRLELAYACRPRHPGGWPHCLSLALCHPTGRSHGVIGSRGVTGLGSGLRSGSIPPRDQQQISFPGRIGKEKSKFDHFQGGRGHERRAKRRIDRRSDEGDPDRPVDDHTRKVLRHRVPQSTLGGKGRHPGKGPTRDPSRPYHRYSLRTCRIHLIVNGVRSQEVVRKPGRETRAEPLAPHEPRGGEAIRRSALPDSGTPAIFVLDSQGASPLLQRREGGLDLT
jgi:hypothetical protein